MPPKSQRSLRFSAVKRSQNKNNSKCNEDNFDENSDINDEYLYNVFDASWNANRKSPTCTFTINPGESGLAAVDVRQLSDISFSHRLSSEVCVLSSDINSACELEENKTSTRHRNLTLQQFKEEKVLLHPANVTALSYTNGNLLLSCSLDGTVKAWDSNYELIESYSDIVNSPSDVQASSKLDHFATSSLSGVRGLKGEVLYGASLFSFSKKTPITSFMRHTSATQCVRFHANGLYLATASRDGTVLMWSMQASDRPVRTFRDGEEEYLRKAIAFSPDGKYLASTHCGSVNIWDIASGRLLQTLKLNVACYNVCFSDSGGQLATGSADGHLKIWNINSTEAPDSFAAQMSEHQRVGRPILRIRCIDNIYTCLC